MYAKVEIEYPVLVEKYRFRGVKYHKYEAKTREVFRDLVTGRFVSKAEYNLHQSDDNMIEPEVIEDAFLWDREKEDIVPIYEPTPKESWSPELWEWLDFHERWLERDEVVTDPDYVDDTGYYGFTEDSLFIDAYEEVSILIRGKRRDKIERPDPSKYWVTTNLNPRLDINNRSQQWLEVAKSIGWVKEV